MCVFSLKQHNPVLYGSWQFSGIVTQGQTAKNRGLVHDFCIAGRGGGRWEEVCVYVCAYARVWVGTEKTNPVALDLGQK